MPELYEIDTENTKLIIHFDTLALPIDGNLLDATMNEVLLSRTASESNNCVWLGTINLSDLEALKIQLKYATEIVLPLFKTPQHSVVFTTTADDKSDIEYFELRSGKWGRYTLIHIHSYNTPYDSSAPIYSLKTATESSILHVAEIAKFSGFYIADAVIKHTLYLGNTAQNNITMLATLLQRSIGKDNIKPIETIPAKAITDTIEIQYNPVVAGEKKNDYEDVMAQITTSMSDVWADRRDLSEHTVNPNSSTATLRK